ncbi:unnamed protein product [Prorocentrum cordatum]|uniref:K Homology domain-containing protein n=1 Tax=Prorocentrum cordatum TaxID=2364126 RepID=A0ABN9PTC2_9DINO|nr:unnamed protein product [Polarella glacialis]
MASRVFQGAMLAADDVLEPALRIEVAGSQHDGGVEVGSESGVTTALAADMVVPDSSEAVKVALLVPDAQAGKVVGKGGACFQMLRAQGCDMTMQSTADTEQFRRADIKGMSGEHLAVGFTTIAGRLGKGEEHSLAVVLSQDMANTFEENGGENIILDQTGMAASLEWGWTTEEAERRVMLNGDGDMLAKCFRLLLKACGVAKVGAGKPVTKPRQMGTGSRLAAGATGMGAVGRPATASKPPPLVAPGAADGSMGGFTPPAGYTPPAARSAGGGAPAFVAPESFGGAGGGGAPAFVPPESFGGAAGGGAHAFVAPESFGGAAGSRGSAKTFTPPSGIGAGAGAVALSSVPGASGGITGRPDQDRGRAAPGGVRCPGRADGWVAGEAPPCPASRSSQAAAPSPWPRRRTASTRR